MTVWLSSLAHSFAAAMVIFGLLLALPADRATRRVGVAGAWLAVAGLAVGTALIVLGSQPQAEVTLRIGLRLAAVAAAAGAAGAIVLGLFRVRGLNGALGTVGALGLVTLLACQAMADFLTRTADHSLSVTTVLNTELILNLFAIAAGSAALVALVPLAAHAGRAAGAAAAGVLALVLLGHAVLWSADLMLGLLQIGSLGVTAGRVSFVARLGEAKPYATYASLALVFALAVLGWRRRTGAGGTAGAPSLTMAPIERRKQRAWVRSERRWLGGTAVAAGFLFSGLLFHDLVASQPPRLSPAAPVTADAEGLVKIPVDQVKDGRLHRFAYVAPDGHRIRFFLINRHGPAHVGIGVVFDACMICGSQGYVQEGNEVFCVSCNVRLFTPSIGKPGGCNPIPLKHQASAETITIAAADLVEGARYFAEIVAIDVVDPVTGAKLVNLQAPHQYDYEGRTYFFESRDSYDRFRAEPDRYRADKGL